ncbi:MAG: hypothetical protein ABIQ89_02230 [Candidatus Saccharimonadales bacterium]
MSPEAASRPHNLRERTISVVAAGLTLFGVYAYGRTTGYDQGFQAARFNEEQPDVASQEGTGVPLEQHCVGATEPFDLKDADQVRDAVAETPFAMGEERLSILGGRIYEAENYQAVEQVMNSVFDAYGVKVVIGELPDGMEISPTNSAGFLTHDVDKFDLRLAQISSENILRSMEAVPDDMMHVMQGTTIYLTAGLTVNGEPASVYTDFSEYNKHAVDPTNNNYRLIIGIGAEDPSAYGFRYGLASVLRGEMCQGGSTFDLEFAKLNDDAGFTYTGDPVAQEDAVRKRQVVTARAASSQANDEIINITALLDYGLTICTNDTDVVEDLACKKRDLIARRVVALYPEMADVISLQTQWSSYSPGDTAKRQP